MSRIFLIPVAVVLAAGSVVLGPGETAPAAPPSTTSSSTVSTTTTTVQSDESEQRLITFELKRSGR